jgi:hypothetical protein
MSQFATRASADVKLGLRPFICRPDTLPPGAARERLGQTLAGGAPDIFPDLSIALAVHIGDQVDFVASSSVAAWGGIDVVLPLAIANLSRLEPPKMETMHASEGRADSGISILRGREPFCASRICDLQGLLALVSGSAPLHGVLLSIPTWHAVVLHVLSGPGVLTAVKLMAQVAWGLKDMASEGFRLDSDVYFIAPDRRVQRVAWAARDAGVTVETRGAMADVLYGPRGLLEPTRPT